ncbi:MAG: hypothetical protein KJ779_05235 [Firmicutes bacterium]|nr:hypothetical protein [Bacillota bacterium]
MKNREKLNIANETSHCHAFVMWKNTLGAVSIKKCRQIRWEVEGSIWQLSRVLVLRKSHVAIKVVVDN